MAPICVRTYSRKQTSCRPRPVNRPTHRPKKPKHELKRRPKAKYLDTTSELEPSTLKQGNKVCKVSKVQNKRSPLKTIQPSSRVNSRDSSTPSKGLNVFGADERATRDVNTGRGLGITKFLSDNLLHQDSSLSSLSISVDTTFDKLFKAVGNSANSKKHFTKETDRDSGQQTSKLCANTVVAKVKHSTSQNTSNLTEKAKGRLFCPQYSLELHSDEELPPGFMATSTCNLPSSRRTSTNLSPQHVIDRKKVYCRTKKEKVNAEVSEHRYSYKLRPRTHNKHSTSHQQDSTLNFSNSFVNSLYDKNKSIYHQLDEKVVFDHENENNENCFRKSMSSKSNRIEVVNKGENQMTYTSTPLKNSKNNPSKSNISYLSPISFQEENFVVQNTLSKLNSIANVESSVSYNKNDDMDQIAIVPSFPLVEPNKLMHVQDQERSCNKVQCVSLENQKEELLTDSVTDLYAMSILQKTSGSPFRGWVSPDKTSPIYKNYQELILYNSDLLCITNMSKDMFESYDSPEKDLRHKIDLPKSSDTDINDRNLNENSDVVKLENIINNPMVKFTHSFILAQNKAEELDGTDGSVQAEQSAASDNVLENSTVTDLNNESNFIIPDSFYTKSAHSNPSHKESNSNIMTMCDKENKGEATQLTRESVTSTLFATCTSHKVSCCDNAEQESNGQCSDNNALLSKQERLSNGQHKRMEYAKLGMQPVPDIEGDALNVIEEEEDDMPLIEFCNGARFTRRRGESASGYSIKGQGTRMSSRDLSSTRFTMRRSSFYSSFSHRKSRKSHVVIRGKLLAEPKPESSTFRNLHGITTNTIDVVSLSSKDLELGEVTDEKKAQSIPYPTEEVILTARDVVLQRCCQDKPVSFSEAFCDKYLNNCRKIGEGVYGEVFLWQDGNKSSVIKIIPIEGEDLVNGERQKEFGEILSEIVITTELSNLRFGKDNQTSCFTEVIHNWCIQDKYPDQLIKLWKQYAEEQQTENDCPDMFSESQLFIVIELANGGRDLEQFQFNNAKQSKSIFLQTALAMAVAETSLEFEHRDLHWGNVLISRTKKKSIHFKLNGEEHDIPSYGVQVTVIDFTLSRMTYDGCCIFNNLSLDPGLFESHGDYQFDIYRGMREACSDNWGEFVPFTNVLWLHYLVDKMTVDPSIGVHYRNEQTKVHQEGLHTLKTIKDSLLQSSCAVNFVQSLNLKLKS